MFSFFKKMFAKNIECKDNYDNELVHLQSKNLQTVTINSNIMVRGGTVAVFVCKDKVCDVLNEGKYPISGVTLPITFNKLKLDKVNSKGKRPTKFKCDIYFVNLNLFKGLVYNSNIPYVYKSKTMGRVKAYSEGTFDLQVISPKDLMEFLLSEWGYVTNKRSLNIIGYEVGNSVNEMLMKSRIELEDILKQPATAREYVNGRALEYFTYMGLKVSSVEINYLSMNSKKQTKMETKIKENNEFLGEYKEFSKNDIPVQSEVDPSTFVVETTELLSGDNAKQKSSEQTNYSVENAQPINTQASSSSELQNANAPAFNEMPNNNANTTSNTWQSDSQPSNTPNELQGIPDGSGQKTCINCGAILNKSAVFCSVCGCRQDINE